MSTVAQKIFLNKNLETHQYHKISESINDSINDIRRYASILTPQQTLVLHAIVDKASGRPSFDASEVDKQYHLLLKIQEQVIDPTGILVDTASVKDLTSVLSAISSVVSLFLKTQAQIDSIKAEADLKDAVLTAIGEAPQDVKEKFFKRLAELS